MHRLHFIRRIHFSIYNICIYTCIFTYNVYNIQGFQRSEDFTEHADFLLPWPLDDGVVISHQSLPTSLYSLIHYCNLIILCACNLTFTFFLAIYICVYSCVYIGLQCFYSFLHVVQLFDICFTAFYKILAQSEHFSQN